MINEWNISQKKNKTIQRQGNLLSRVAGQRQDTSFFAELLRTIQTAIFSELDKKKLYTIDGHNDLAERKVLKQYISLLSPGHKRTDDELTEILFRSYHGRV